MAKCLYVFRGIPGSGKTTQARKLQKAILDDGKICLLYEADMYWMTEDGQYKFNPNLLGLAHDWCRNKVREGLKDTNTDYVIVANTNLTEKEMNVWEDMANELDVSMVVVRMNNDFGNIHGVPPEAMERMRSKLVPWPNEMVLTSQRTKILSESKV